MARRPAQAFLLDPRTFALANPRPQAKRTRKSRPHATAALFSLEAPAPDLFSRAEVKRAANAWERNFLDRQARDAAEIRDEFGWCPGVLVTVDESMERHGTAFRGAYREEHGGYGPKETLHYDLDAPDMHEQFRLRDALQDEMRPCNVTLEAATPGQVGAGLGVTMHYAHPGSPQSGLPVFLSYEKRRRFGK